MLLRNLEMRLKTVVDQKQSALLFGPRQTGKTTLVSKVLESRANIDVIEIPLQNPEIRREYEKSPSKLIQQIEYSGNSIVFIDEAQKVPELFDAVQYLIDKGIASFIITGSSARKLRKKGTNLLPGRVKSFRLDPLEWNELHWKKEHTIEEIKIENLLPKSHYTFEKSLVYGSLPGIVTLHNDEDRRDFLQSYSQIYLEEEIRAEALSRKMGAFHRFLELAAQESGLNINLSKLSLESGVSVPTIKEYYSILEDTLVVEKIEPYRKNTRKRILTSPRYYFFDLGVRNALARLPLEENLMNAQKGILFEHAVVLEIIRRIRSLGKNYKLYYWRTTNGAEVDCIIDTGIDLIPIEIKSTKNIHNANLKGLKSFLHDYSDWVKMAYVVSEIRVPEIISERITAIPWSSL